MIEFKWSNANHSAPAVRLGESKDKLRQLIRVKHQEAGPLRALSTYREYLVGPNAAPGRANHQTQRTLHIAGNMSGILTNCQGTAQHSCHCSICLVVVGGPWDGDLRTTRHAFDLCGHRGSIESHDLHGGDVDPQL